MLAAEAAAIVLFVILLLLAIGTLGGFYICDHQSCRAYRAADAAGPPGSIPYFTTLLEELYNDGMWASPYIGASIAAPLALWFVREPITVMNFAIFGLIFFVTLYVMTAFLGHHYIQPITESIENYIDTIDINPPTIVS